MPAGLRPIHELQHACGTNDDPASVDVRSGLVQKGLRLINRECLTGAHERERKALTFRSTDTGGHGHAIFGTGRGCIG
jgi:hypothetical protein